MSPWGPGWVSDTIRSPVSGAGAAPVEQPEERAAAARAAAATNDSEIDLLHFITILLHGFLRTRKAASLIRSNRSDRSLSAEKFSVHRQGGPMRIHALFTIRTSTFGDRQPPVGSP